MTKTIDSFSYSRLNVFNECPFKAKLIYIDKLQEPSNKYMERGSEIHKKLEDYMLDDKGRMTLPQEAGIYKDKLAEYKNQPFYMNHVEIPLAFDRNMNIVDWVNKKAWLRVKYDLVVFDVTNGNYVIIDYKTGRPNDNHKKQADLYAATFFVWKPDVDKINVQFWYVDNDDINIKKSFDYTREVGNKWLKYYMQLGENMTSTTDFKAKCGPYCKWCHFRKNNGGPCGY